MIQNPDRLVKYDNWFMDVLESQEEPEEINVYVATDIIAMFSGLHERWNKVEKEEKITTVECGICGFEMELEEEFADKFIDEPFYCGGSPRCIP